MQDEYAGQAGTFIVDGEAGVRVPAEEWDSYQAAKSKPQQDQAESIYIEVKDDASHS